MNKWLVFRSLLIGSLATLLIVASGCGSNEPVEIKIPQTYNNMKTLGAAYLISTQKHDKPPKQLSDLRPYVAAEIDLAQISKSENDGEDFVIVWGVDYRSSQNEKGTYPIVIYEKKGKEGFRFVCQFNDVLELDEAQFKAAYFPPGHVPTP